MKQNESNIKDIPEEIRSRIISFLPLDEAVRTSILSKSWNNLWTSMPRINFEPYHRLEPDNHNPTIAFPLASHKTNLESSVLHHSYRDILTGRALNWVNHLVHSKHVQILTLVNGLRFKHDKWHFKAIRPVHKAFEKHVFSVSERPLFGSPTLRFLELGKYVLKDGSALYGALNLTTLKLSHVTLFSTNSIAHILSNCPNLTNLSINHCLEASKVWRNLIVCSNKLQFLEVRVMCPVVRLCIDTPRLRSLVLGFQNDYRIRRFHINTPLLDYFQVVECVASRSFLRYSCGYQRLDRFYYQHHGFDAIRRLSASIRFYYQHHGFDAIRRLSASIGDAIGDAKWLSYVLGLCKCLQVLDLEIVETAGMLSCAQRTFWEQEEIAECVTYNLKSVIIRNFSAMELDVGLIRYVILNGVNLEKVVIYYKTGMSNQVMDAANHTILSTPRASNTITIFFKVTLPNIASLGPISCPSCPSKSSI